jgi:uncharacterized membrane protein YoaK (UPF0700 family)
MLFASIATATAGFFDAVGYQQLNHLYVSFMSGNSTHLGMELATGNSGEVIQAACVIAAFAIGAFIGTLVAETAERPLLPLAVAEAILCVSAAALASADLATVALILIALTMGMQNAMHQNISGTDMGKGFITGAVFGIGQALARSLKDREGATQAVVHGSSWLSFISGVIAGAYSVAFLGTSAALTVSCVGLSAMIFLVIDDSPGAATDTGE